MKSKRSPGILKTAATAILLFALHSSATHAASAKLKVFILAGQSNMEGHAKIETFDYIGDDPKTAPLLKEMRGPDGQPHVCDNVWITYHTGMGENLGEGFGKLTAGYGSRRNPKENGGKIGPEFTFGIYMDKALGEPVLLIKTAWGGKSLFHDFRPPRAGPYQRTDNDIKRERHTAESTGHYYRLMVEHVHKTLKNIRRIYPEYDEKAGYEIAGFVWFQGFNDMVNREVYPIPPKDSKANRFAKYSVWMTDLIRDVRKDLKTPKLPFIIGVMGVGGMKGANEHNLQFREAMAAPASLPEFKGNVTAVRTGPFFDETLGAVAEKRQQLRGQRSKLSKKMKAGEMTRAEVDAAMKKFEAELISKEEADLFARGASNQAYHYLGSAKTFAVMGKAFADALLELMKN
ncbi:MAG: sialate O-acetylesterase [Verrucomicrobiia bacterium]